MSMNQEEIRKAIYDTIAGLPVMTVRGIKQAVASVPDDVIGSCADTVGRKIGEAYEEIRKKVKSD